MPRTWTITQYVESDGTRPVQDFVRELLPAERGRLMTRLKYLQREGLNTGGGVIKNLHRRKSGDPTGKLWELRLPKSQHNPRVLFFATTGRTIVLLHGFKKIGSPSDTIPRREIDIALRRMQDHEERRGTR